VGGSIKAKIANRVVLNITGTTTMMKAALVTTVRSFAQVGSGKRTETLRRAPMPGRDERSYGREIIEPMQNKRLILALFAVAILFSMVREWNAPSTCARAILILPATAVLHAN
jgi:hypothetical protein